MNFGGDTFECFPAIRGDHQIVVQNVNAVLIGGIDAHVGEIIAASHEVALAGQFLERGSGIVGAEERASLHSAIT